MFQPSSVQVQCAGSSSDDDDDKIVATSRKRPKKDGPTQRLANSFGQKISTEPAVPLPSVEKSSNPVILEPRISEKKRESIKFFEQISDNSGDDSEEIIVIDSDDDDGDDDDCSSRSIDSDDDDVVGSLLSSISSAAVENAPVGQVSTNY